MQFKNVWNSGICIYFLGFCELSCMDFTGEEDLSTLLLILPIQKLHQLGNKICFCENGMHNRLKCWTLLYDLLHSWEGNDWLPKCDADEVLLQKICAEFKIWQLPEQGSQGESKQTTKGKACNRSDALREFNSIHRRDQICLNMVPNY